MAGNWGEPERMWDEYDWERFLQQQDGKTEKYMQLLETYLDDPRRDEIIAREMGWTQLLDEKDWSAEVDALLDENSTEEQESEVENAADSGETFQEHDLYRAAFDPKCQIESCAIKIVLLERFAGISCIFDFRFLLFRGVFIQQRIYFRAPVFFIQQLRPTHLSRNDFIAPGIIEICFQQLHVLFRLPILLLEKALPIVFV